MAFERPANLPFPSEWFRFDGKKPMPDGEIPKFVIQDLPEDREEEALKLMCDFFLDEEVISKYCNITKSPASMRDVTSYWRNTLKQKLWIACFRADEQLGPGGKPTLVGVNTTHVVFKDNDGMDESEGPEWTKLGRTMHILHTTYDVFEHFGVDKIMQAGGLYVKKAFSGQGVGVEILKARINVGRAVNIKVSASTFTSPTSQAVAAKAGFKQVGIKTYEEIEKEYGIRFPGITSPCIKYMMLDLQ